jgi:hypothetical protein
MLAQSAIRMPSIARERRRLIRDIQRTVAPYLWDSGYRTCKDPRKPRFEPGNRRPLKLWSPLKDGKPTGKTWKLRGTYVLTEFQGFTEHGLITDCESGMIVTTGYDDLPLEDLLKLMDWVRFKFLPLVQPTAQAA